MTTDSDAEIDALDDDVIIAMVGTFLADIEARMPDLRRWAILKCLEIERAEYLEIAPAPTAEPAAMVESALDRLAAAPPELEPLAAVVAAATRDRRALLAAAMARRRKAERPRLAAGAFRTSGRQQRAIRLQRDTAAAAMSSCRSRRAP